MRQFFENLFRDDVGGPAICMYNWVHILYLVIICSAIFCLAFFLRNKEQKTKQLVLKIMCGIIVGLYLTDFLVHPFMEKSDSLLMDKLPFHACTSAAILLPLINIFPKQTKWARTGVVLIGMLGAFFYVFIPSGVTGPDVMAFRYRTIQTFIYHGTLLGYGVLSILWGDIDMDIKKCWHEAIILVVLIGISLLANYSYTKTSNGEPHDWFFSTGASFGINPVAMPFVLFGVFFGTSLVVYGIYYLVKFIASKRQSKVAQ